MLRSDVKENVPAVRVTDAGISDGVRPGMVSGKPAAVRATVPVKLSTLVTLMVESALVPAGMVRVEGFAKRKNVGFVTRTEIVVELLTLPGVVVPATPIEYGPGVVDEVVVIVSVEVAVLPEFNAGDAGSSATIGRVGFGI
jgi:hypothetical protein